MTPLMCTFQLSIQEQCKENKLYLLEILRTEHKIDSTKSKLCDNEKHVDDISTKRNNFQSKSQLFNNL